MGEGKREVSIIWSVVLVNWYVWGGGEVGRWGGRSNRDKRKRVAMMHC